MTFDNPEVIELGLAVEVIQDHPCCENTEGTMPEKTKASSPLYAGGTE